MFDVLTVGAIADELQRTVLDGRIQKIGLVNQVTIAAEVYAHGRRRPLVISADSAQPRIMLAGSLPSVDPNLITPFGLQLRKYLRGGFLIGVEQPPLERMVRLSIAKRLPPHNAERGSRRHNGQQVAEEDLDDGEEGEEHDDAAIWSDEGITRLDLYVEIMGRHSNLILVDSDGLIMESAKRVTSQMSRVRSILPRQPYAPPPPQDKPDPRRLTSAGVDALVQSAKPGTKISDLLVRGLRGVSPQVGKEAAFQMTGDAGALVEAVSDTDSREVASIVRNLFEPLLTSEWSPRIYEQDGAVVGYAAMPRQYLAAEAEEQPVASISEAVARSLDVQGTVSPKDHAQRRARLVAAIEDAKGKVEHRLRSLREQHARAANTERLREWGELIYAYIWQIEPGQSELSVDGTTIPLDPSLSAKENAQEYFEQYRKAQKAGDTLPERIAAAEQEVSYLAQLQTQAEQSEGFAAIEALRLELDEHTGGRATVQERGSRPSKKQAASRRPQALHDVENNTIYIGRSGRENDQVTFDIAGPEDTWFHARGVPGSHVIVRWNRPGADEDEVSVETAAALAAWYSASRESGTVEVDVAKRKHVRKIKGSGPGMVTYRNERTIAVHPLDEDALKQSGRLA